jgi:protein gp37
MGQDSKIEWTHHTFNPWRGCTKVSPGCVNCYADTLSKRNPGTLGVWGRNGSRVVAGESYWKQPHKWNAAAQAAGERHRVFCASLADVFEGFGSMPNEAAPVVEAARRRLWEVIDATPALDWLLLTKRPENVKWFVPSHWLMDGYPPNVWIGTSVEDQQRADERIPHLLTIPARVRFLSCEPLLGPVDLSAYLTACEWCGGSTYDSHDCYAPTGLDWVIVGGESGHGARPMHPTWARSLRDQCNAATVAYFFKQWGEFRPQRDGDVDDATIQPKDFGSWSFPDGSRIGLARVGKHAAGRVLDGRTWDEVPVGREERSV